MPNLNDTRAALEDLFITGWNNQTPIAYDNVKYTETLEQSYVEIYVMPHTTNNVTLGANLPTCKRVRHKGVVIIIMNTPIEQGSGLAYVYADQVSEIMQNKTPVSNLLTYASSTRRSGASKKGWFSLINETPYTSDD